MNPNFLVDFFTNTTMGLLDKLKDSSALFDATGSSYLTFTRHTGLEVVTVTGRTVKITEIATKSSHTLDVDLEFDPTALSVNGNESLLCLYNETSCHVLTLNEPGSTVNYTTVFKLLINFKPEERIIETHFHNVSKFQSELVLLTNYRLIAYDLNSSTTEPSQIYNFGSSNPNNTFDTDFLLVDPVSFTFGSGSVVGDLTLFLLTSDFSIYVIYPFLPRRLSVSKQWLENLFDYTSLLSNLRYGSQIESLDAQYIKALRLAALLKQSSGEVDTQIELPREYQRSKISGPLPISSFLEELYYQSALKLFPLAHGLLAVVLDHGVVILDYEDGGIAIFANDTETAPGKFCVLDAVIFAEKGHSICTGILSPDSTGLLLTTSEPGLAYVNFAKWLKPLNEGIAKGDVSEFNSSRTASPLPTTVTPLGAISHQSPKSLSVMARDDDDVPFSSLNNLVWLVWDTTQCYAVAPGATGLSVHELYEKEEKSDDLEPVPTEVKEYNVQLKGRYSDEVGRQLARTEKLVIDIQNKLAGFSGHGLNPDSVQDLELVKDAEIVTSTGVISLFGDLMCLSRRLTQQKAELKNQVSTLQSVQLSLEGKTAKQAEQVSRLNGIVATQDKLEARLSAIADKCSQIVGNRNTSKDLSRDEVARVKYLNSVRGFVLKKQKELDLVSEKIKNVGTDSDLVVVPKDQEATLNALRAFKKNLEARDRVTRSLVKEFSKCRI